MLTNRIREWRKLRGLSMDQLAEAARTTKGQIHKLETSKRRLTVDWVVRLAKPLGCDPRELMTFDTASIVSPTEEDTTLRNLPIHGTKPNERGEAILTARPVDYVPRPYYLAQAREAYGLLMPDNSMVPMYRKDQILFVNPTRNPMLSKGVVLIDKGQVILVREFGGERDDYFLIRVYKPEPQTVKIPHKAGLVMHLVLGTAES